MCTSMENGTASERTAHNGAPFKSCRFPHRARTQSRTMYITKHGKGYRVQVEHDGRRSSKVLSTHREAKAWGAARELELGKRGGFQTLGQAVERYLATVSTQKRSVQWERRRLYAIMEQLGADVRLADIDSDTIGRWRDERLRTVSGSTVQRESNLLRNLFSVAMQEWRWIERNPFTGVRLPAHNAPRRAMWTWPLIKRVLRAQRTGKTAEMQHAFRIALATGMRLSEVLSGVYDVKRCVVMLERTKTGGPAEVPVPRRARKLFPATFTVGANEGSVLFSKLCKELLIDGLTFHDTRGSALTWLSRRVDVLTLARISRHQDLRLLSQVYYRESAAQIAARL